MKLKIIRRHLKRPKRDRFFKDTGYGKCKRDFFSH